MNFPWRLIVFALLFIFSIRIIARCISILMNDPHLTTDRYTFHQIFSMLILHLVLAIVSLITIFGTAMPLILFDAYALATTITTLVLLSKTHLASLETICESIGIILLTSVYLVSLLLLWKQKQKGWFFFFSNKWIPVGYPIVVRMIASLCIIYHIPSVATVIVPWKARNNVWMNVYTKLIIPFFRIARKRCSTKNTAPIKIVSILATTSPIPTKKCSANSIATRPSLWNPPIMIISSIAKTRPVPVNAKRHCVVDLIIPSIYVSSKCVEIAVNISPEIPISNVALLLKFSIVYDIPLIDHGIIITTMPLLQKKNAKRSIMSFITRP